MSFLGTSSHQLAPCPIVRGLGNPTALQDSPKAAGAKKSSHHYSCLPSALLHFKVSWNPVGSAAFTGPRYNESPLQPDSTCGAALSAPVYEVCGMGALASS